jgi:DMSO/TMAO reductase YedYZ molybdopterin-dependent catalytic subunit
MRQMKLTIVSMIILVMIAVALSGCTTSTTPGVATPTTGGDSGLKAGLADNPNYKIEIVGGNSPVTITFADIKAMNFVEKKGVVMINSAGTETTSDYVGVPMMDIINKAGLPAGDYNFKVSASDGYMKVYTKAQMENAILGLKENGTPLTDNINKNSIRMVMPGEAGEMWMKVPAKIELTQAASSSTEPFVLNITGVTAKAIGLKMSKLQSYPVKSLSVPYKNNTTLDVSGPSLNKLLDDYAANVTATKITFIASDGFNKTLNLADVRADQDAIIAIDKATGSLRVIMPSQPYSNWVSKLANIELA